MQINNNIFNKKIFFKRDSKPKIFGFSDSSSYVTRGILRNDIYEKNCLAEENNTLSQTETDKAQELTRLMMLKRYVENKEMNSLDVFNLRHIQNNVYSGSRLITKNQLLKAKQLGISTIISFSESDIYKRKCEEMGFKYFDKLQ